MSDPGRVYLYNAQPQGNHRRSGSWSRANSSPGPAGPAGQSLARQGSGAQRSASQQLHLLAPAAFAPPPRTTGESSPGGSSTPPDRCGQLCRSSGLREGRVPRDSEGKDSLTHMGRGRRERVLQGDSKEGDSRTVAYASIGGYGPWLPCPG